MSAEPNLGAVFDDRSSAEAAVDDLRRHGLADEHLGVAVRQTDSHVFEEDSGTEVARGLERGIVLGAPIGAVAGITVLALFTSGLGVLGVGGVLAAGGVTGGLAGGFWGGYLGLRSEGHVLEEEVDWDRVPLDPGQVLVVVAGHGHPQKVTEILRRHDGEIVTKPPHPS